MKKALPSLFFLQEFSSPVFLFLVSAIGVEPDTENVDVSKGITHEQFPDGLSFPWLNAYTDGVDDKDDPDEKHFFVSRIFPQEQRLKKERVLTKYA